MSYFALALFIKQALSDRNILAVSYFVLALYTLIWYTVPSWTLPGIPIKVCTATLCIGISMIIARFAYS